MIIALVYRLNSETATGFRHWVTALLGEYITQGFSMNDEFLKNNGGGAYWRKLKMRLNTEGDQLVTFCHGLKLQAPDGKQRETDCANTEGLFRISVRGVADGKEYPS